MIAGNLLKESVGQDLEIVLVRRTIQIAIGLGYKQTITNVYVSFLITIKIE